MQKAIIYCRVSSERQVKEGHGLKSQEQRCRERARQKQYKVVKVFYDDGVSGSLFERPAMINLIKFLDANLLEKYVIIFDDLSRFARDVKVHIQLKAELVSRGAMLECLNFNFDDSDESEYAELVLAAGNQYQRKANRRQVLQKMKARLEDGFWPFCPPKGLVNKYSSIHGKVLTRKEPYATIYKNAIENYCQGIINSFEQGVEYVNKELYKEGVNDRISKSSFQRILTNPLYAGYIEYKPWGVSFKKGKHEGFITFETFKLARVKLDSKSKATQRKDYNIDFPIRGFVECSYCRRPLTASWHKGRNKYYAHYFCKQKNCIMVNKTVRKEVIESEFKRILCDMTPNKDVMNLVSVILKDIWSNKEKVENENKLILGRKIEHVDGKKQQYMDRISKTSDERLINEYEQQIRELLNKKEGLENELPNRTYSNENFGIACDTVLKYIENPVRMWQSENYQDKRLLLEMYFKEKLTYDLKEEFGITTLEPLVSLLIAKEPSKNQLVEMVGVEPTSKKTL